MLGKAAGVVYAFEPVEVMHVIGPLSMQTVLNGTLAVRSAACGSDTP